MATETIERPRTSGPGSGLGGNWQVIVLNDDHNTFDHVAKTLASVIPGVSVDAGYRFADRIHASGRAVVWTGPREPAELYWQQLEAAGLTMAPLEQH
jgi:ATP-dependent Clp protease adaptor protein ClpS